jgi:molybdopterin/thiamine biosynthesis adenylyltransferase
MDTLKKNREIYFDADSFNFVVVGCGGNGSFLVPNLARIISINNKKYQRDDTLTLVDGDEVEEKNIARQNFITADIGKNKAEVLANRYSRAFGIDISYIDEYVKEENIPDIMPRLNYRDNSYNVILGCVDNNATRHILHAEHRSRRNMNKVIYIDAGNEEFAGQIVFSANQASVGANRKVSFNYTSIKDIVEEFNLDSEDKHPEDLSCAERALSAPQNIATNIKAADLMLTYCNQLISGAVGAQKARDFDRQEDSTLEEILEVFKSIPKISSHIIYFNAKTGQASAKYFNETIQNIIEENEENSFNRLKEKEGQMPF